MRTLRTGENHVCAGGRSGGGRRQAHLNALVAHELQTGTPMDSPAGVAPEQRSRPHRQRMQQHAHLPRLCGGGTIPLALLAQRTRAAVANASRIHHAQAAVGFSTPLLGMKRLFCGTTERSVGLEQGFGVYPKVPKRAKESYSLLK